jgi:hypothetical protein
MRFDRVLGLAAVMFVASPQGPALAAATQLRSVYTTLQKCKRVTELELPERTLRRSAGDSVVKCPGVDGYSIYLIDDDPRSWLVLERDKRLASLERQMVSEFKLGNFPNVAATKVAEWRVDRSGKAWGLIVRVAYQRSDISANSAAARASALLTFDVRAENEPALLGATSDNAEARALITQLTQR